MESIPQVEVPEALIAFEEPSKPFEIALNALRERVQTVEYKQLNLLNNEFNITQHPVTKEFLIENFYQDSPNLNYGTCRELRDAWFTEIKREENTYEPFKTVLKAVGKDGPSGYFNTANAIHCFILVSQVPFTEEYKFQTQLFITKYCYLIDPSFQRIEPFKTSGYVAVAVSDKDITGEIKAETKNCTLEVNDFVPLAISETGDLWMLANHSEHGLCFTRKEDINGSRVWKSYPLNHPNLFELLQDSFLTDLLRILQEKVREMNKKEFIIN